MDTVRRFVDDPMLGNKPIAQWDAAGLLKLMWETWNDVFGRTFGRAKRSLVQELRDWRNKWAHQEPFSSDDTDRTLGSMNRLLTAVSAPQADEVRQDENGVAPSRLRGTGARRKAQSGRLAGRAGCSEQFEAVAGGGDAARRRGQRSLMVAAGLANLRRGMPSKAETLPVSPS
jgi:hypothetical protein